MKENKKKVKKSTVKESTEKKEFYDDMRLEDVLKRVSEARRKSNNSKRRKK